MADLSPTARVILGMIHKGKRTGYDIKALVDRSTRFFWAASYGQIYPELKRLEADGLIRASAPEGGRRRTEYELTAAGEQALRDWITSTAELTYELRDEGLLKFFFGSAVSPGELREQLDAMAAKHEGIVASLRELEPFVAPAEGEQPSFGYLTLRGGIEIHEFTAGWCRRMQDLMTEREERPDAAQAC
ncbi:MAG: PadR family transcriptional regulator [Thermoleophilaceae bacterium]